MTESKIQIFNNPQFGDIRTAISEDNEPLLCLADVCKALDLGNPSAVKARLESEDVYLIDLHALNSNEGKACNSMANFITESGLYEVILGSRSNPKTRPFKKWVTSEVLPSIRKTGGYIAANDNDTPEMIMARAILVANDTIERQKKKIAQQAAKIEADAPYVDYAESIMKVEGDLDMQSVARVLADNNVNDEHGKPIGRNYLFKVLRRNLILMSDRRPYQKYVDKAYFGCYVNRIDTGWGEKVTYVPTVTPKGLKWLLEQIDKGRLKGIGK